MIAVAGSVNRDIVVVVDRHPIPGETVLGRDHLAVDGGKGANQAVAAARLGADVVFIGRVGSDAVGDELRTGLSADGIDVSHLASDRDAPSGLALITVDARGENAIVVSPGANGRVGAADVEAAADVLATADVVLLQLEIPMEAVMAAAALARNGIVVLNPAPAQHLPPQLLERVDVLVPNRHELTELTGSPDPASAADLPVPFVVVTMGAAGAAVVDHGALTLVPAVPVDVVDTTGAGDAFCGALATFLAAGDDIHTAVGAAAGAGALAATATGARTAMPRSAELGALLGW